ncbi:MAG: exo-alpha-sialidase [Actinobacteria bacterium]|nr:exo-alpha-sialidase [Actinomycetota bacterium]
MGFTVVGPNRFLGSGHPDLREAREKELPSRLGLIKSTDAGKTWDPVSLPGKADFHVLRTAPGRIYGFDATDGVLRVSRDGGNNWSRSSPPAPLIDLAADPTNSGRLFATSERGLHASADEGRTWSVVGEGVGLLAWPAPQRLYLASGGGQFFVSPNAGERWRQVGDIGGEPAALLATGRGELYAALHDGTIKRSRDGGGTWGIRSTPS